MKSFHYVLFQKYQQNETAIQFMNCRTHDNKSSNIENIPMAHFLVHNIK